MAETSIHPDSQSLRPLVVSVLTGPIVWSVHLMASYVLVSLGCITGFVSVNLFGLAGFNLMVLGLTLVAVVVIFGSGRPAFRSWQEINGSLYNGAHNLPEFLALLGVLSSSLFGLVVMATGLPAMFYLYPC